MLEIAVIKTTPQSSEAPSQNARKPVDRNKRDDDAETFQKEYETSADRSKKNGTADKADAEKQSDTSAKTETPAKASENPNAKASSSSPEKASEGQETGEIDEFDGARTDVNLADADQIEGLPDARRPDRPDSTDAETAVPGLAALAETPRGAAGSPGVAAEEAAVNKPAAKPLPGQGRSTAESVVMSKALEGAAAQSDDTVPAVAKTSEGAALPPPSSGGAQGREPHSLPQSAHPIAHEKVAAAQTAKSEEARLRRTEHRYAEVSTQPAQTRTTELVAKAAPKIVRPVANIDALREKGEPLSIAALDAEGFGASETRSASAGSAQSLTQILSRPETPAMIARQMAEVLQRLPDRPVEISLNPKELGRVRMNISAAETGITVSVMAERPETLDLMRRNIDQLAREFQSIGYENINFAFSEGEAKQQFADDQPEHSGAADPVTRLELTTAEDTPETLSPMIRTSGLDIRL